MVEQYPHTLTWVEKGTNPTTDNSGFPVPGNAGTSKSAICRYENFSSGNRKEWTGRDGETVIQKGTIYVKFKEDCPVKFENIEVNDPVNGSIFKGEILNVYKGQLNYTIAV